jgi:nitroreductase
MQLLAALRTTGAIRSFTDEAVSDETIAEILDTARFAPSGGNRQPWRVAVVRDRAMRGRLAELMQPTWDEYIAARADGQRPFNPIDYEAPVDVVPAPNELLDTLVDAPAVLVIATDLAQLAAMDLDLERMPLVSGASIYPFCWSVLLAAHHHGLGGVLTTFLARSEPAAASLLDLPVDHAIAAMVVLGVPVTRPTKLARRTVSEFATIDRFSGAALDDPPRT